MALKTSFPRPEHAAPAEPPCGVLADKDKTAHAVRFVTGDRSVSFPISEIVRWELSFDTEESLRIFARSASITVHGHGLHAVRDALDAGQLLILAARPTRFEGAHKTVVTRITVEMKPG